MPEDGQRQLYLPEGICRAAEDRFGTRFGDLEQFLTYVLQQLLRADSVEMDQAEQKIIEERLKDLGYI
ncbi:MAG: hypothetical protein JOY93_04990 [Acidobacteriales bacterium]|nr:hypothetical protein [Terriglobales bacterium]